MIAEQKFGVQCDLTRRQRLFELAAAYRAPILAHWQAGSYNPATTASTDARHEIPCTNFIGHAQTFWANIDKANVDNPALPDGKVTPGGLTDRHHLKPTIPTSSSAGSRERLQARS